MGSRAVGFQERQDVSTMLNVISCNAAISACEQSGQWSGALSVHKEMQDVGVMLNVISCYAAISACEKGGQWEQAL